MKSGTITLTYFTDYTANFMQVSADSGVASTVKFFFANNYVSNNQNYYKYASTDATLLADLSTSASTSVKVSFIYGSNTLYAYILRTDSTTSKVIKYSLTNTYTLTKAQ